MSEEIKKNHVTKDELREKSVFHSKITIYGKEWEVYGVDKNIPEIEFEVAEYSTRVYTVSRIIIIATDTVVHVADKDPYRNSNIKYEALQRYITSAIYQAAAFDCGINHIGNTFTTDMVFPLEWVVRNHDMISRNIMNVLSDAIEANIYGNDKPEHRHIEIKGSRKPKKSITTKKEDTNNK